MTTFSNPQVVFNKLVSESGDMTHVGVKVTKTATMVNGSMLVAAGTEALAANAALVTYVINDPKVNLLETGDVIYASCAQFGCIFNKDVLTFSDSALAAETLTILDAKLCSTKSIQTI